MIPSRAAICLAGTEDRRQENGGSQDPDRRLAARAVLIDDPHGFRSGILVGSVNQDMGEGLHAFHVLRILYRRDLDHPTSRPRLFQVAKEIVQLRHRKLLEGDMKRGFLLRLQLTLRLTRLLTGLTPLRGLSFHRVFQDEPPGLRLE
jgi:hypothetical protein